MADVTETHLPGVGTRYDLTTATGERLGVLVRRGGRRSLYVSSADDPDACAAIVELDADAAQALAELVGTSSIVRRMAAVEAELEGLDIDWLRVEAGAPWSGLSLADAAVRRTTGVSIVALVRNGTTLPSPAADEVLGPGDVAVAVGTAEGLAALRRHITR